MTKDRRKIIISKSLKFRTLRKKDILFVNMVAVSKNYCFTCNIDQLDNELEKKVFAHMCFLTECTIQGKTIVNDRCIIELTHFQGKTRVVMDDGEVIECLDSEFDFDVEDCLLPTKQELKQIILESLEEF